jgi:MFS superfamily sulfate permease-like transporter
MMMTIRRAIVVSLFSFLTAVIYSQDKDFGLWYNISIEHEFTKKLEVDLLTTIRTFDNASKIEEGFIEGEIAYKFTKFLSAAASYRITENIEDDDAYHLRHKWFVGLKGNLEIWDLDFSARVRYQERYKTYFEDKEDKIPDSHFRFKVKSTYKTPSFPLNPFIGAEIFCPVFKESDVVIDKKRFSAGVEYKISKKHSVELEYLFQRDYKPDLRDDHIISLNYKFKF